MSAVPILEHQHDRADQTRRVAEVEEFIRRNLHRDLTTRDLAGLINVSESRLFHLFRTQRGTSPARMLKQLRMQEARKLLTTTWLSIKQIRAAVGIHDASHFTRDFRRYYGIAPSRCGPSVRNQD
jgi:AraC family transcriptional regulator of arabinose operon